MSNLRAKTKEQKERIKSILTSSSGTAVEISDTAIELHDWFGFDDLARAVDYLRDETRMKLFLNGIEQGAEFGRFDMLETSLRWLKENASEELYQSYSDAMESERKEMRKYKNCW